ncbi:hypothetical protein BJ165DRAFT_1339568, partial [Panaeolus papilionaceus]
LIYFKNKNRRGQREGTRSRAIIDRVHERARLAADRYRCARKARLAISGNGDWEKELQILSDADIRSYRDPDKLKKSEGRKGTLTDAQLQELGEQRSKRDGTGETRRTISWIWLGKGAATKDMDGDTILRAEWSKSRARVKPAKEEVPLLREEMRRVLEYLEWKAKRWLAEAKLRDGLVDSALREGLHAYSHKRAKH